MVPLLVLPLALGAAPSEAPAPRAADPVAKGLKWLAARQAEDGSWSGAGGRYRTTITAYAGLALLMEGSTPREGPYAAHLRRAVRWFERNARPDGLLVPPTDAAGQVQPMSGHAAALLFLAEAHDPDAEDTRKLGELLAAAVGYAAAGQSGRGGWAFAPAGARGVVEDPRVSTAMIHALLAARGAGVAVPPETLDRAAKWVSDVTSRDGGVGYAPQGDGLPRGRNADAAATGVAAAAYLTTERREEVLAKRVGFAKRFTPSPPPPEQLARQGPVDSTVLREYLALARLANALGETGHRKLAPNAPEADLLRWSTYREPLFRYLRAAQRADGSWADANIGPAYASALALIMLQLDNNFVPAFAR